MSAPSPELFRDLDPSPRLLMGPGPVDVYPRVLRAMSAPSFTRVGVAAPPLSSSCFAQRK